MSVLHDVAAADLQHGLNGGEVVLIDVREPSEHAAERIPHARPGPLSAFAADELPESNGKRLVLYCKSGNRSRKAAQALFAAGHREVYHLDGGLMAWERLGHAVATDPTAPIDVVRQVQMIAGACILSGVALGAALSPWFLALSSAMGAGLLYAGLTNTCGLATLLARMPWNRSA